jgi:hypothetical protein
MDRLRAGNTRLHLLNAHSYAAPTHQSCTDLVCFLNLSIQHYPSICIHFQCLYFHWYMQSCHCTPAVCTQLGRPSYPSYHHTLFPTCCCSTPQQSHNVHLHCPDEWLRSMGTLFLIDKDGYYFSRYFESAARFSWILVCSKCDTKFHCIKQFIDSTVLNNSPP